MAAHTFGLQKALLEKLLSIQPMNAVVATLVPLLKQSRGNVYKKLRLEVPFSADEQAAIARHYTISLDALIGIETNVANGNKEKHFEVMQVVDSYETMTTYLRQAHTQLLTLRQMPGFSMVYVARDLPLFHYFAFPQLGALKAMTWVHENLSEKPNLKHVPEALLKAGEDLYTFYRETNSTEIWSYHTLDNTLENVVYYTKAGLISQTLAVQLFAQLRAIVQLQKETVFSNRAKTSVTKQLVHSPFIMMSNGALMHIGETRFGMLAISSIQTIVVHQPDLLHSLSTSINWHMHHGTVLHEASDAEIERFFNALGQRIGAVQQSLKK